MATATKTIRQSVIDRLDQYSGALCIHEHEAALHVLYAWPDGTIDIRDLRASTDFLRDRETGTDIMSIHSAGTGSQTCNCDACTAAVDPYDWAAADEYKDLMTELLVKNAESVPAGYFDDEK